MARGDCCTPPPPSQYEGSGYEEKWGELDVYVTGSPSSASAVLFICDIYGWEVPQTRALADKLSAHGHYVAVPDFMEGDYYSPTNPDDPWQGLQEYLDKHSKPAAAEKAAKAVEILRGKGVKKLGVMGNCWGGKITAMLLQTDSWVDAAVMNHPSFLTHQEIEGVRVPLALLGAEIDFITPPELAREFGEILAKHPQHGGESLVKIFEGGDHGFTTRFDEKDPLACQRAEEAHNDAISFFARYLL